MMGLSERLALHDVKAGLFHGGMGRLTVGDLILPGQAERRIHAGCPDCEAHARGEVGPVSGDPATPSEWVYACSDRQYARYYASLAGLGWVYRVDIIGAEHSPEDPEQFGAWRGRSARVVSVLERAVRLTMRERRRLFVRWGGTSREFDALITSVYAGGSLLGAAT